MLTVKGGKKKALSLAVGLLLLALGGVGCATTEKTSRAPTIERHARLHVYHDSSGVQFPGEPRTW